MDQENQAPEGLRVGVLAPKRGKMMENAATTVVVGRRPVLGEISQNISGQLLRPPVKPQASFPIYCDETVGKKEVNNMRLRPGLARPALEARPIPSLEIKAVPAPTRPAIMDKENILPLHMPKSKKVVGVDGLRQQQSLRAQLNPSLYLEDKMSISLVSEEGEEEEEDSPMMVEVEERQQWRVPPIHQNLTVDIFSEPEYFQDIYQYLKESELKHMPKWNYMTKQTDITHTMRSILVDWLVEVGEEYKLQTETLFLAVSYVDRFLSFMAVQRSKLQLVGTACMFIAAKYEEIYPPDVSEFVYITDDTYNKRQVLRMEHLVLKVLEFQLSVPTAHLFVNNMCQMIPTEEKVKSLALYLSEMSLVDGENFLRYPPSQVAAAALALARHTLGLEAWPQLLASQAGYQVDEFQEILLALHNTFSLAESSAQQAVRDKYRAPKYHGVSDLCPPSLK